MSIYAIAAFAAAVALFAVIEFAAATGFFTAAAGEHFERCAHCGRLRPTTAGAVHPEGCPRRLLHRPHALPVRVRAGH